MWDPPPGLADMQGDAELAEHSSRFMLLDVPGVGAVQARRPMPNAVPVLACSADPDTDDKQSHLTRFVRDHLADGEHERIIEAMMGSDAPADSMGRVARGLATWGTARPYVAVISLALMSATHWRTIRTRLRSNGIADPMGSLPHMHALLDEAEAVWVEALHTGSADKDKFERQQLFDRLYAPEPAASRVNGDGYRAVSARPAGFEPKQVEASFDAFASSLSAR